MKHHRLSFYIKYRKKTGKRGLALLKKVSHDVVSELVGTAFEFLCKTHVCKPYLVVMVDGGICSQMNQYLLGQIYAQRGEDVLYDLTWYEKVGTDVDGHFARTFELEEMFPDIHVQTLGKLKRWFYRTFLMYVSTDRNQPDQSASVSPTYFGGYYDIDDDVFSEQFDRLFNDVKRSVVPDVLKLSSSNQFSCAVHVRRGDLARGDNPWYGGVADDYFFRAIEYVERLYPHTRFFFFSDEMAYVKTNIVPNLSVDYVLIPETNKAFEDLLLISKCDIIVASQGSFGKFAALLNRNSTLVLCDNEYAKPWLTRKKNTVVL